MNANDTVLRALVILRTAHFRDATEHILFPLPRLLLLLLVGVTRGGACWHLHRRAPFIHRDIRCSLVELRISRRVSALVHRTFRPDNRKNRASIVPEDVKRKEGKERERERERLSTCLSGCSSLQPLNGSTILNYFLLLPFSSFLFQLIPFQRISQP